LASVVSGSVAIDGATVVQGDSKIEIDPVTGLLQGWTVGGRTMLSSGPVLNLGERRPPGSPLPAKDYIESKRNVFLKNVRIESGSATVTVTGDAFIAENPERLGVFRYTLTPKPDGQLDVDWSLDWTSSAANAWELGVRFFAPTPFKSLEWHRDAPWTEYPENHPGRPDGSTNVSEVAFRSTKRDVRWLALSNGGPSDVVLLRKDSPLHARAREEEGAITLFASVGVTPPRNHDNSTPELDVQLKKGQTYRGSLSLRIVAGKR
jgi:hypothetical protein